MSLSHLEDQPPWGLNGGHMAQVAGDDDGYHQPSI